MVGHAVWRGGGRRIQAGWLHALVCQVRMAPHGAGLCMPLAMPHAEVSMCRRANRTHLCRLEHYIAP